MSKNYEYDQRMDVMFQHGEVIDVPTLVEECTETWYNQTLTKVNDSVARLGIVMGEYHWHKHDEEDEFFFVLVGQLYIDLEDRTLELKPSQGATISKGVMHRPRAPQRTLMLMVETDSIDPIGTK